jgi:HPt (histidine-containing phosphotransfer) domain-containing protein
MEEDFLAELRKEYQKTIPEKLSHLEQLAQAVKGAYTKEAVAAFRMAVHKIAGSAGTYGYAAAGELCHQWDQDLMKKLEAFRSEDQAWVAEVEGFLSQLRHLLQ